MNLTYKWAKDFSLQLISQYTIAGTEVQPSYNNQADYLDKIPNLLNDAQLYVATTVKPIRTTKPLTELTRALSPDALSHIYTVPDDCWQLASSGLIRFVDSGVERFRDFYQVGHDYFTVPVSAGDNMLLEYFRYPISLPDKPSDLDELDNKIEAQRILPYYVAAQLVMYDNSFAYSALNNEFESRLQRMQEVPLAEVHTVKDLYGGE